MPSRDLAAHLSAVLGDVDIRVWKLDEAPPAADIDLVVLPHMDGPERWARLHEARVRLVQGQAIGYDKVAQSIGPGMVFANASSVHETSTSELALALTLASQRQLPEYLANQSAQSWAASRSPSLAAREVLILGAGGVGTAVAARLLPFEVSLTRVASRARALADGHWVHGVDELPNLLPRTEVVIVTVPLSASTRGMVDDAFLSTLPDGALLVNIARGAVVNTEALVDHVRRGRIRAALDVTDPEPLPAGHPLWSLPGVILTPHVGGATSATLPRMVRLIERQVRALAAGEEPQNVVLRT